MSAGQTAMFRTGLSRPLSLALADGVLRPEMTVFDYGCGRGTDIEHLRQLGLTASGWDPAHAPSASKAVADVVNLGYVVNVIREPDERAATLRAAWGLAREVLVVAARLDWDISTSKAVPCRDGVLTARGTFQKFYTQDELRDWVQEIVGVQPTAAGPGVFYVFRSDALREAFLARGTRIPTASARMPPGQVLEQNRELLEPLLVFLSEKGRIPSAHELAALPQIIEKFGSTSRALSLLARAVPDAPWETVATRRQRDLLVYLALGGLRKRPALSTLSTDLQFDIRAFFGTYRAAVELGQSLLFSAGDQKAVAEECVACPVGKQTPDSLYVHVSAVPTLPLLLRVLEGCARALLGDVPGATLVKFRKDKPKLSYLCYPEFDSVAHPSLSETFTADLSRLRTDHYDYRIRSNPPVLHRKECFVALDYPERDKFARLTRAEEVAGLLREGSSIGTRDGWSTTLAKHGYAIAGHRLRKIAPTRRVD